MRDYILTRSFMYGDDKLPILQNTELMAMPKFLDVVGSNSAVKTYTEAKPADTQVLPRHAKMLMIHLLAGSMS